MTATGRLWCPGERTIFQKSAHSTHRFLFSLAFIAFGLSVVVAAHVQVAADSGASRSAEATLCLDGFCIGQPITDDRFDKVKWLIPKQNLIKKQCSGVGCQPAIAFRGYEIENQEKLADTLSWVYSIIRDYNVITETNLAILRTYKYECNPSARGIWERDAFWDSIVVCRADI